jgi:hypothetical protein
VTTCHVIGKAGDHCSPSAIESCAAGFVCNGLMKCQAPSDVRGPCDAVAGGPSGGVRDVTCKPGLGCAPDGTCVRHVAAGAACKTATECALGYGCQGGVCVFGKEPGEACTAADTCVRGTCNAATHVCDGICWEPE